MAPLITLRCGPDDKPAEAHRASRQLGQQYCPTLPCQILIMNARVRLMRKRSFAFEVSSSVPKNRIGANLPGTDPRYRLRPTDPRRHRRGLRWSRAFRWAGGSAG